MDIIIILLLGGAIAFSWSRIDKLERRVIDLTDRLDRMRRPFEYDRHAEPERPAEAADIDRVQPAAPIRAEIDTGTETGTETEPPRAVASEEPSADPILAGAAGERAMAKEPAHEPDDQSANASAGEARGAFARLQGLSFDFEDIFGRRLPIWGGGFALAIAGIFLVRFSIEAGLMTPMVRVAMSFVFGVALLAGAEAAFRYEDRLHDPRVRQSLAGAGLATLYGAFYLAGTAYGLIGAGTAFVGLAAVTAGAIALSFRFGLPSAVIGLIGGFAAPLLVDSDSANIPLLSFYLALITGGLAWSGQAQNRSWLGYAALAAGLGWGALMMFGGVSSRSDFAALGIYFVVLGTVLPAFLHSQGGPSAPKIAAGAIATLQMAVLVSDAGFAPLTWGLYLLIGAALAALGWRYPALRPGSLVAAGLGLWLLAIWPDPDPQFFALVAAGLVAIFAMVPLASQWLGRARLLDLAQLGAVALVTGMVVYAQFGSWGDLAREPLLAASMAGLALLPAAGFALIWRRHEEAATRQTLALLAPAALLAFAALLLISPAWMAPLMALVVSAPLIWCYWRRDSRALHIAGWAGAVVTAIALAVTPDFAAETSQLGDAPEAVQELRALLRWVAAALPFACMAIVGRSARARGFGEAVAVVLLYGAIAQIVPSAPLAWIAALAAIALLWWQESRNAAWATALAISALWVVEPLAEWVGAGVLAMIGEPFMARSAIAPLDLALRIAPFAAVLAVIATRKTGERIDVRTAALVGLGVVAAIAVHSLYKQVFAINSLLRFEFFGLGERTVWQAGLLLGAYGAWQAMPQGLRRPVSLGLIALSLAHFAWFTLIVHNPLIGVQHVGPTPIANWLTLAYLAAIGAVWLAFSIWEDASASVPAPVRIGAKAVTMALISLLGFSLLRQVFAGTVLVSRPIGQTESLLVSLLGIVLALGFLWWGSWRNTRSWRIGSLVLMLGAVIKVFLIDAAGLEGLLRIASFMALGFSLIGIGWVYSRQLSQRAADGGEPKTPAEAG